MTDPTPIQIHIPPTLTHYALPLSTFTRNNPGYTHFHISTFIFSSSPSPKPVNPPLSNANAPTTNPSTNDSPATNSTSLACQTRLLLLQRSSLPNAWEPPTDSISDGDPTILHSAARATFELTGLKLVRFVGVIGKEDEVSEDGDMEVGGADTDKGWKRVAETPTAKKGESEGKSEDHDEQKKDNNTKKRAESSQLHIGFSIQVAEIPPLEHAQSEHHHHESSHHNSTKLENAASTQDHQPIQSAPIMLDPASHQAYTWVSEDIIRKDRYTITTPEARGMILRAFDRMHGGGNE